MNGGVRVTIGNNVAIFFFKITFFLLFLVSCDLVIGKLDCYGDRDCLADMVCKGGVCIDAREYCETVLSSTITSR